MSSLRKRLQQWRTQQDPLTAHLRWELTKPGFIRLVVLPPEPGKDPLREWKAWGYRVSLKLGRLPGNWKTKRGIKKRKKALMSVY